jgi:uncharacterized protein (TIGR02186 family)
LALALALALAPGLARAQALTADLTSHLIAITTGFVGAEVVLFGAVEGEGDVIVVVRGPESDVTVRRKENIAGIWLNRTRVRFDQVPGFYAVAASRSPTEAAPVELRRRERIGVDMLPLPALDDVPVERAQEFRQALIATKRDVGQWPAAIGEIRFVGPRLFRTTIAFPANTPTGNYQVNVYLLREGRLIGAQTTPLLVSKLGTSAEIVSLAQEHALAYGVGAVAIAVLAGWLASLPFRRG